MYQHVPLYVLNSSAVPNRIKLDYNVFTCTKLYQILPLNQTVPTKMYQSVAKCTVPTLIFILKAVWYMTLRV